MLAPFGRSSHCSHGLPQAVVEPTARLLCSRGRIDGDVPKRHAGVVHSALVTHATPSLILLRTATSAGNESELVVLTKLKKGVNAELDELRVDRENDGAK